MKTSGLIISFVLSIPFYSCQKNNSSPITSSDNTNTFCYFVYDAETGEPIKAAEIGHSYETISSGENVSNTLYSDKKGMACVVLPAIEEFHKLSVKAPGYLKEEFNANKSSIALSKPCFLRLHIQKKDENKSNDLLIIDYKISSEQSEQIILKGKTDTIIMKQADPRGKLIKWIFNNVRDSVFYNAKSGEIISATISL